jgi:hypothetical protein
VEESVKKRERRRRENEMKRRVDFIWVFGREQ